MVAITPVPDILTTVEAEPIDHMDYWALIPEKEEYQTIDGLKRMLRAEVECGPNRRDIVRRLSHRLGRLVSEDISQHVLMYSITRKSMTQAEYKRKSGRHPSGKIIPGKIIANPLPKNKVKFKGLEKKTTAKRKRVTKKKVTSTKGVKNESS